MSGPEVGKLPRFCHHTGLGQSSHESSEPTEALPRGGAGQYEAGARPPSPHCTAPGGFCGPRRRGNVSLEDPLWVSSDPRPRKHTKPLTFHLTCVPCSNAAKDLQVGDLKNSSGRPVGAEFLYYWLLLYLGTLG